jgi:CRISPR-associated protein Cmr4
MIEMFEKTNLLGLYSVTPVHAGSGSELSVIDLPIQRERYTKFPLIWGQSLKGALRGEYRRNIVERCKRETDGDRKIKELKKYAIIFGKEQNSEELIKELGIKNEKIEEAKQSMDVDIEGAISVGDAKILLFPVRSLKGVFAYVTCPFVLEKFMDILKLAKDIGKSGETSNEGNENEDIIDQIRELNKTELKYENKVIAFGESLVIERTGTKVTVLEDILLDIQPIKDLKNTKEIVDEIAMLAPISEEKLVIVNDNVFKAFVTMTTEIVARTKIDARSGTVAQGGLWYEEYLPADTLLYSTIAIGKPRIPGKNEHEKGESEKKILQMFGAENLTDAANKIAEWIKKKI